MSLICEGKFVTVMGMVYEAGEKYATPSHIYSKCPCTIYMTAVSYA